MNDNDRPVKRSPAPDQGGNGTKVGFPIEGDPVKTVETVVKDVIGGDPKIGFPVQGGET